MLTATPQASGRRPESERRHLPQKAAGLFSERYG